MAKDKDAAFAFFASQGWQVGGGGEGDDWWADEGGADWWAAEGAGFSPTQRGWHNYATGPNLVCAAAWSCTADQMADYLSRFAFPGQNPSIPVISGNKYFIAEPRTGLLAGEIVSDISADRLTVINETLPDHVFYNGVAVRRAFLGVDGAWYVTTHSYGNNWYGTAWINNSTGPDIFNALDRNMLYFIMMARNPMRAQ